MDEAASTIDRQCNCGNSCRVVEASSARQTTIGIVAKERDAVELQSWLRHVAIASGASIANFVDASCLIPDFATLCFLLPQTEVCLHADLSGPDEYLEPATQSYGTMRDTTTINPLFSRSS